MKNMARSWTRKPFVAVKAFDAKETLACPADYPEELLYDIWLGTRVVCDCLERLEDPTIALDIECESSKKNGGGGKSDGCFDQGGIAPIVLSAFNGVRYCGR